MNGIVNLYEESFYLDGARAMLLEILNNYKVVSKEKFVDSVCTKAEIELILSSKENTREFLYGGSKRIVYYDHQKDKKGRLVSCKAKFEDIRRPKNNIRKFNA